MCTVWLPANPRDPGRFIKVLPGELLGFSGEENLDHRAHKPPPTSFMPMENETFAQLEMGFAWWPVLDAGDPPPDE